MDQGYKVQCRECSRWFDELTEMTDGVCWQCLQDNTTENERKAA